MKFQVRLSMTAAALAMASVCVADDSFDRLMNELSFGERSVRPAATLHTPQPVADAAGRPVLGARGGMQNPDAVAQLRPAHPAQAAAHHFPWDRQRGAGACDAVVGCDGAGGCGCGGGSCQEVVTCDEPLFKMPKLRMPSPRLGSCLKKAGGGDCGPIVEPCGCPPAKLCGDRRHCQPRRPVNLPRGDFYGYWTTDRCYTGLWDGYTRDCGKEHDHLHGRCDCKPDGRAACGEVLPARCGCEAPGPWGSSGGCDATPCTGEDCGCNG